MLDLLKSFGDAMKMIGVALEPAVRACGEIGKLAGQLQRDLESAPASVIYDAEPVRIHGYFLYGKLIVHYGFNIEVRRARKRRRRRQFTEVLPAADAIVFLRGIEVETDVERAAVAGAILFLESLS